jgi:hypothetical protein
VNEQSLAVLISYIMLGVFLFAVVAMLVFQIRSGRIRRSPLATRREKNVRHLVTIGTLGLGVTCAVVCMLVDSRLGVSFILGTAFFALFVAPMRTVFVESGLRRMNLTHSDATHRAGHN